MSGCATRSVAALLSERALHGLALLQARVDLRGCRDERAVLVAGARAEAAGDAVDGPIEIAVDRDVGRVGPAYALP